MAPKRERLRSVVVVVVVVVVAVAAAAGNMLLGGALVPVVGVEVVTVGVEVLGVGVVVGGGADADAPAGAEDFFGILKDAGLRLRSSG
jgi:hypothetical protein